jgi:hypothetical protein
VVKIVNSTQAKQKLSSRNNVTAPVGEVELVWEKDFTRFYNKAADRHSEFDEYADFA